MADKTLEELVAEAIEPHLEKQFYLGMQAGYNSAIGIIYGKTKTITTMKEMRQFLKQELN